MTGMHDLSGVHGYLVSHRDILVTSRVQLTGEGSILDRTLVLRSAETGRTACATIRSTRRSLIYRALMRSPLAGQVIVRQNEFGTAVHTHIYDTAGERRTPFHSWAIVLSLEDGDQAGHESTQCRDLKVNGVLNMTQNLDLVPVASNPDSPASRMFYYTPKLPNLRVITGALYVVVYDSESKPFHHRHSELKQNAYSYGIDELPIIRRGSESSLCPNARHTIYNPTQISPDWVPKPGKGTNDQYAVGDLSGKYGTLQNRKNYFLSEQDPALSLFGKNSVIGRALMIYTPGQIIMTQDREDPDSDTTIYAELSYIPNGRNEKTYNHPWSVHESWVFSGQSFSTTDCFQAGNRYNPANVSATDYSCACSSKHPRRCDIGDMTTKTTPLDIPVFKYRRDHQEMARYLLTDSNLPLSGPNNVIGKSILLFGPEHSTKPLVCANIGELNRRNEV
ncbi:hypothetical protein LAZ67_11000182 [Cordylochernes scorpioides]|uniref:Copper radical oxidase n=1 Tax=Cordylochernes scorpioides TaxID=51811 RepID=A0ABY6KXL6_9ARAC|nr:hypothetical protein LAZ67_11000182 [Cordylochernes scorpioides]